MRYIDLTLEQDNEPTYNGFQIFGILSSVVGIVGVLAFGTLSLISSL